jgi:RHS repeat-associated protein
VGGVATNYVFNAAGQRVSEWSGTLQLQGKYYWGGKPVAYYANGAAHFEHQDWLGTERMRTAYNGVVEGSFTSLPFGDWQTPAGDETDANHYATLDHDTETDTDHAQFRQYANAQGRWLAPDPYSGSYDMSNPQSMNRYVYAGNNPLAGVDPQGLNVKCSTCTNSPGSTNDPDFSFDPGANGSVWSGAISGFSYSSLTSTWIPGYEVPYEDYVPGHWEYQWTYNNYAFSNMSNFGVAGVQGAVGPVLMALNNGPSFKQKNQTCFKHDQQHAGREVLQLLQLRIVRSRS